MNEKVVKYPQEPMLTKPFLEIMAITYSYRMVKLVFTTLKNVLPLFLYFCIYQGVLDALRLSVSAL
jgi:hypothetical protein